MKAMFWQRECARCGFVGKVFGWDYEMPLACPTCGEPTKPVDNQINHAHGIVPDEIPGGLLVEHAICNPDGTPKRYYSKSEIRKAANDAGWTIVGESPRTERGRWI